MALRHWDGMSAIVDLSDLDVHYVREGVTTNIAVKPDGGPQGRGGVRMGGVNLSQAAFYRTITSSSTVISGFWINYIGFDTSEGDLHDTIHKLNAGASDMMNLRLMQNGTLRLYQAGSTLLFDSNNVDDSPDGLTTQFFGFGEHRVEVRVVISSTVGELDLWVDGIQWCRKRNVNTGSSNITRVYWVTGEEGAGAHYEVGELYVFDGTGSLNNEPLHYWREVLLNPTSDDAVAFTRNTGAANFETVDDEPADADTTHNASTANAQVDRFATTGTIAGAVARVHAVNVVNVARRESAAQNFRCKIRHGGVDGNGTTIALPSAEDYRPQFHSYETNPSTTAQWTAAEVAAATFGYESMA